MLQFTWVDCEIAGLLESFAYYSGATLWYLIKLHLTNLSVFNQLWECLNIELLISKYFMLKIYMLGSRDIKLPPKYCQSPALKKKKNEFSPLSVTAQLVQ